MQNKYELSGLIRKQLSLIYTTTFLTYFSPNRYLEMRQSAEVEKQINENNSSKTRDYAKGVCQGDRCSAWDNQ